MSIVILILQDIMENRFPLKLGAAYLGHRNLSGILILVNEGDSKDAMRERLRRGIVSNPVRLCL